MNEIFPVVAGVLLALLAGRLDSLRSKLLALMIGSVVIGAVASFISGELFVSWGFLVIDSALVLLAAGVTMVLVAGWERSRRLR